MRERSGSDTLTMLGYVDERLGSLPEILKLGTNLFFTDMEPFFQRINGIVSMIVRILLDHRQQRFRFIHGFRGTKVYLHIETLINITSSTGWNRILASINFEPGYSKIRLCF